jgi:hypothetical protein
MKKIITSFVALALIFSLSSCEKDYSSLLTDGAWTFDNMTTDSENEDIRDNIALWKAFLTDAILEFQAGGDYMMTSPLSEEPTVGTWSLVGDDQLIMEPDDEPTSINNIETLSKKKLVHIETFVDQQMNPYSVTTTWVR